MLHGSDLKKYKSADCFNMRTKQSRGGKLSNRAAVGPRAVFARWRLVM
ncbi:hypothetical protein F443_05294 [Phytophthora nicotianae P1569]|uniref:Uncharacterized protein n=1 Tax=Phytophthora nicotianae P1569 TaxID=1317065 RepID=V9FIM1_PHYNI|nr:hypothetical protein F443_05294 [Phytophthora nicotianae P1569]